LVWNTVQGGHLHHVCGGHNFAGPAKWPKSKRESGENMLILLFSYFGCLFQFLG
jgi:hypothetical protein